MPTTKDKRKKSKKIKKRRTRRGQRVGRDLARATPTRYPLQWDTTQRLIKNGRTAGLVVNNNVYAQYTDNFNKLAEYARLGIDPRHTVDLEQANRRLLRRIFEPAPGGPTRQQAASAPVNPSEDRPQPPPQTGQTDEDEIAQDVDTGTRDRVRDDVSELDSEEGIEREVIDNPEERLARLAREAEARGSMIDLDTSGEDGDVQAVDDPDPNQALTQEVDDTDTDPNQALTREEILALEELGEDGDVQAVEGPYGTDIPTGESGDDGAIDTPASFSQLTQTEDESGQDISATMEDFDDDNADTGFRADIYGNAEEDAGEEVSEAPGTPPYGPAPNPYPSPFQVDASPIVQAQTYQSPRRTMRRTQSDALTDEERSKLQDRISDLQDRSRQLEELRTDAENIQERQAAQQLIEDTYRQQLFDETSESPETPSPIVEAQTPADEARARLQNLLEPQIAELQERRQQLGELRTDAEDIRQRQEAQQLVDDAYRQSLFDETNQLNDDDVMNQTIANLQGENEDLAAALVGTYDRDQDIINRIDRLLGDESSDIYGNVEGTTATEAQINELMDLSRQRDQDVRNQIDDRISDIYGNVEGNTATSGDIRNLFGDMTYDDDDNDSLVQFGDPLEVGEVGIANGQPKMPDNYQVQESQPREIVQQTDTDAGPVPSNILEAAISAGTGFTDRMINTGAALFDAIGGGIQALGDGAQGDAGGDVDAGVYDEIFE